MVYAMLVDGLDSKDRERFDAELYGYAQQDQRALRELLNGRAGTTNGDGS